jgi:hypothetical protein
MTPVSLDTIESAGVSLFDQLLGDVSLAADPVYEVSLNEQAAFEVAVSDIPGE